MQERTEQKNRQPELTPAERELIRSFVKARDRYLKNMDPFRRELEEEFRRLPVSERLRIALENGKRCRAIRELYESGRAAGREEER